jgi:hypothetical protein
MTDKPKTEKVTVQHTGRLGMRFFHDHQGNQVVLRPGEVARDIQVTEAEAERLREQSKAGQTNLVVDGHEPEQKEEPEQLSRGEIEERERKNLEAARKAQGQGRQQAGPRIEPAAGGPAMGSRPMDTPDQHMGGNPLRASRSDLSSLTKEELASQYGVSASQTKEDMIKEIMSQQKK